MTAHLPPAVRSGDRVGVAALSGPVPPAALALGLEELRRLGFDPVPARNLEAQEDLFAGSDALRLEALHELADDDSLAAIFFARGGHGVLRLLAEIDWQRIGRRPRAWIGYSDLTPFLGAVVDRLDLVAFHGPMVASDLVHGTSSEERASLLGALAGQFPTVLPARIEGGEPLGTGATAEGVLRGGCLSMLCSVLGSDWSSSAEGAILALEDSGEPTYRIDRMLTHLDLSGNLAGVRGVALGWLRGSEEIDGEPSSVAARVARVAPGVPVVAGFDFGHERPNRTLPLGAASRLHPATRTLTVGMGLSRR
jgi:muramoyltetrapeptide carboxypeptidase